MKNPFLFSRFFYYFLTYEMLAGSYQSALDFGCGTGDFIGRLGSKVEHLFGFDIDPDKVSKAAKSFPSVNFRLGNDDRLPYKDNYFDVVFTFHVLEHVSSEEKTINEIYRVLKKKGELYIAVPHKGIFAWADSANLRYKFPTIHKILAPKFYGEDRYKKLFINKKNIGLYGDLSSLRKDHHHYSEAEIRRLMGKKFFIKKVYKYSLFQPLLLNFENIIWLTFKMKLPFMRRLIWLDSNIYCGNLAYNALFVAEKG